MKNILEFLIKKQIYGSLIIVLVTCIIYQLIIYAIDKVTIHQDGSKTALPVESYKQSNTFC